MSALIGFVFGYVLGAKAGPERFEELKRAWRAVIESEEVKGLFATATASVQSALPHGGGTVAEHLERLRGGEGELGEAWRRFSGGSDLFQAWSRISESGEFQQLLAVGTTLIGNALTQARSAAEGHGLRRPGVSGADHARAGDHREHRRGRVGARR